MRVLLIDRSPVTRNRLARLLSEMPGVRIVEQAQAAATARRAVQFHRPDVVVIDPQLEGVVDLELLRDIKGDEGCPFVVVLTHDPSQTFQDRCTGIADLCVDKALAPAKLVEMIQTMVGARVRGKASGVH